MKTISKTSSKTVFASIIPAAGKGARLRKCKAGLPFGTSGKTLLSHIISVYLSSKVSNIFIITGYWESETVAAAQNFSSAVTFVHNDNPGKGMFSSVCKGVSQLDTDIKYFFVHPVDIPLVNGETIVKMKNAMLNSKSNETWLAPRYKNEEGHPVLMSSLLIPELLSWSGERGLEGFLSSRKDNKKIEHVEDEGTIFDIDCQEDFLYFERELFTLQYKKNRRN